MVEGLANMLLAKLMDLLILLFIHVQRPKRPLLPAKIFACQKHLFIVNIYYTPHQTQRLPQRCDLRLEKIARRESLAEK